MGKSVESRWFFLNEPYMIGKWFTKIQPGGYAVSERIDHYLDIDGNENFSFKISEGKIELKIMTACSPESALHAGIFGTVQRWEKWGPELNEELKTKAGDQIFKDREAFIAVKKVRQLLKYEVQTDGSVHRANESDKSLKEGCQVELTRLSTDDRTFYTFGIEAFGSEEKLADSFKVVSDLVFNDLSGMDVTLNNDDCYSYPVFLNRLGAHVFV